MAEASRNTIQVDDEVSFRVNTVNSPGSGQGTIPEVLPEQDIVSQNNNNVGMVGEPNNGGLLETGDRCGNMDGLPRDVQFQLCDIVKNIVRGELQRSRLSEAGISDNHGNRPYWSNNDIAEDRSRSSQQSWPRNGEYRKVSEGRPRPQVYSDGGPSQRGLFQSNRPHSVSGHSRDSPVGDWPPRPRDDYGARSRYVREDLSIKVRPYDPREVDWLTFRGHFEAIANQAAWSGRTKCARLMSALPGSLTGVVAGLPEPIRYGDLVTRLDTIHGISNSREDAILKLGSCRKGADENISLFAERVRQLVQRAYPDSTNASKEEQALRVFLQGLPARHDMRLHMRMQSFRSLREAADYGVRLEQVIKDEKFYEQNKPMLVRSSTTTTDDAGEYDDVLVRLCSEVSHVKANQEKQFNSMKSLQEKWNNKSDKGLSNRTVNGKHDKNSSNTSNDSTKDKQRTKENSPCFYCSELGHWKNECPVREKERSISSGLNGKKLN